MTALPLAEGLRALIGEPEVQAIAVLHHIFLALQPEFPRLARARLAVEGDVVCICYRLRADEALLEIGVDDARRLRGARALLNGPGARLLGPTVKYVTRCSSA